MLLVIKIISLITIVALSTFIGNLVAKRYNVRVKVLEDLYGAMELLETRIKYTYDSIADSFEFISQNMVTEAKKIFLITAEKIRENNISAGDALRETADEECSFLDLDMEDTEVIKGLGTSLGQTNLEGQLKNVILIRSLIKRRLDLASNEKQKNYKLSRDMGVFLGLVIMIILI